MSRWTAFLLFYIALDFCDPSIPGVFFFESERLFVDGVVQAKAPERADAAVARAVSPVSYRVVVSEVRSHPSRSPSYAPEACSWPAFKRDCATGPPPSPEEH